MRLVYAILLTILSAALLYVVHVQMGAPPEPHAGACDQADIVGAQAIELARLGQWLLDREVMGLVLMAVAAYALLYFQVVHAWHAPLAWLTRGILLLAAGIGIAFFIRHAAEAWVLDNARSCLFDAVQSPSASLGYSSRLLPVNWRIGVFVDALAFAVAGCLGGWLVYLFARRVRA